jgi:hypothetical protein
VVVELDEGMTRRGRELPATDQGGYRGWTFPPQGAARMALHFKLQLVRDTDGEEQVSMDELVVLNKDYERLAQVGLTLAEILESDYGVWVGGSVG